MNRTAVALVIVGSLTFLATAAILWHLQQADAPAPQEPQVAALQGATDLPLMAAKAEAARSAEARRADDDAAAARERRDLQERSLQAGYQDDVRQLRAAQERQAQQQRAMELAEQALRQEQQAQARRVAAEQAAHQAMIEAEQQRQLAAEQQEKALQAERVRLMLERNWLYWRYPIPRLP
jgi:hypothetical protein